MLVLVVIWVIVVTMFAPLLVFEGLWAARWLMNVVAAFAARLARHQGWTAIVRTAQKDSGGAGILPAFGLLAAAVAMWCWARRVLLARVLRLTAVCVFLVAAVAAFLHHGQVDAAWERSELGTMCVGLALVCLAEIIDPKITGRPTSRVVTRVAAGDTPSRAAGTVQLSASIGAVGSLSAILRVASSASVAPGVGGAHAVLRVNMGSLATGRAIASGAAGVGRVVRLAAAGHAITSGSASL